MRRWLLKLYSWAIIQQGVFPQKFVPRPYPRGSRTGPGGDSRPTDVWSTTETTQTEPRGVPTVFPSSSSSPSESPTVVTMTSLSTEPPIKAKDDSSIPGPPYDAFGVTLDVCEATCKGRCHVALAIASGRCFCDSYCELYGDCCPDFYIHCKEPPSVTAGTNNSAAAKVGEFGRLPGPERARLMLEGHMREQSLHQQSMRAQANTDGTTSCEAYRGLTGEVMYLRVINKCPEDSLLEDRTHCEDTDGIANLNARFSLMHKGQRTRSMTAGYLFSNVYCAHCHGFRDRLLLLVLEPSFDCGSLNAHAEFILRSHGFGPFLDFLVQNCSRVYDLKRVPLEHFECEPEAFVAECDSQYSGKLDDFNDLSTGCLTYNYHVVANQPGSLPVVYKNPHCALCNGVPNINGLQCFSESHRAVWNRTVYPPKFSDIALPSFSLLMNVDGSLDAVRFEHITICPSGSFLDLVKDTCINNTCPAGQVYVHDNCSRLQMNPVLTPSMRATCGVIFQIQNVHNPDEAVSFVSNALLLVKKPPTVVNTTWDAECALLLSIEQFDAEFRNESVASGVHADAPPLCIVVELESAGTLVFDIWSVIEEVFGLSLFAQNRMTEKLVRMMKEGGFQTSNPHIFDVSLLNHSPSSLQSPPCKPDAMLRSTTTAATVIEDVDFQGNMTPSLAIFWKGSGLMVPYDDFPALLSWKPRPRSPIRQWSLSVWSCFCLPRIFTCDKVLLPEEAVTKSKISDRSYATVEGVKGVLVCRDEVDSSYTVRQAIPDAEGMLTLCGIIVSLVGLAATFVTYSVFAPLRTRPGLCVMHLCVALFTAQILFEVAPLISKHATQTACVTAGALQHYSWLAAFLWMNVMAFDLSVAFGGDLAPNQNPGPARFRFYLVYAWGLPALIISMCMCLHFVESVPFDYIDLDLCWLPPGQTVFFLFGLPLALIMLLNIVLFVKTACALRVLMTVPLAHGIANDEKGTFIVCLKIFVLMGISWILEFVAMLSKWQWTTYAFIIVNSLQGVFIWLSFGLSARVRGMCHLKVLEFRACRASNSIERTSSTPESGSVSPVGIPLESGNQ